MTSKSVLALTSAELRAAFAADGIEPFRAGQVARWVFARRERGFARMSDLGRELSRRLAGEWETRALECRATYAACDGTRKLVLATAEGAEIEAVLIPEEGRQTLCVSSQAGCSLDCTFCATGRLGLLRNLRAEEIVDQVLHAAALLDAEGSDLTHVVFMGMGEPLANLRHVVQAIRILVDPGGLALSSRRITVSTAGLVPRMAELGRAVPVRLAVSLHATTDAVRDRLVPLNRRFPIAVLLEACRSYPVARRDRLSIEYTLIREVNDSPEDASRLAALLRGLRAKVNLIPLNEHPGTSFRRPDDASVDAFAERLADRQLTVTVRRTRGADVFAACGQLGGLGAGIALEEPAAAVR